jgi:3-dehydroquinate synthase
MNVNEFEVRNGSTTSKVLVGLPISKIADYCKVTPSVLICDRALSERCSQAFSSTPIIDLKGGESIKSLSNLEALYKSLLELEIDRGSFALIIGGGTVCDMAALAASTFMRGIRFGLVPSTLLAQVDAAIGGKNGINFLGYKNIVGTINQPDFVVCDPSLLETLSQDTYLEGFSEIVKHALIRDKELFSLLENNTELLVKKNLQAVLDIISPAIKVKTEIVSSDQFEHGERMLLNFGHSVAHAIEHIRKISHGHAVSIGMIIEARISAELKGLPSSQIERISKLLRLLGLPTECLVEPDDIFDAILKDKKRRADQIYFAKLEKIGNAKIISLSLKDLKELLHAVC